MKSHLYLSKFSWPGSLFLFFFLAIFHFQANAYSLKELSDSAVHYYEAGKYIKAIGCYEKIIDNESGRDSWTLHYNLGNCYFKNNQLGFAIWHYELATKLNPSSEDLKKNLEIAINKVTDKIKVKDVFIETEIQNFLIFQLTTTQWAWLSIVLFVFFLSAAFFFYFAGSPLTKRTSFWMGILTFICFLTSMIFGYMELEQTEDTTYAVVVSPEAKLGNAPENEGSGSNTITLHEGTRMKILTNEGKWSNIQLSNGNEGWLLTEKIRMY